MKTNGRSLAAYPVLGARQGTVADSMEMGRIAYGPFDVAIERAAEECARIVGQTFAFSVVVTRQFGAEAPKVVAVENAALILPWFTKETLASDEPYVHNRIRETTRSPFPTEEEVAAANAGEGLDLLLAHFAVDEDLDPTEAIRARGLLVSTFTDFFSGNRLRSILVETVGVKNVSLATAAGFQIVKRYGQGENPPYVLQIDMARALEVQNFHLARILQYRPPVLRLPPGAREILRFAIQGVTDSQIRERYGISAASLTSRWSRLFDIAESVMPEMFPPQKNGRLRDRLPLLGYIRNHPEELWPYDANGKSPLPAKGEGDSD